MDILKKIFFLLTIISVMMIVSSCDDDDDDKAQPLPEVDRGNVHPNRFKFNIVNVSDSTDQSTFEFYDLDGTGSAAPIVLDTFIFKIANRGGIEEYRGNIEFYKDSTNLTQQIRNLSDKYTICYRDQYSKELIPFNFDRDVNNVELGLSANWEVQDRPNDQNATGQGNLRITLNYNILAKDGTCDAGVRVFVGTVPYRLKVN